MANSSNGRLWFTAGIDRSELSKGVTAINRDFAGLQTNAGRTGSAFSDMWKTAAAGVGAYLSATAALNMSQQIINLTRQRELMEKSFEVLFGGADAAMQKIEELRDYAIITPYTFENLTKGAQTLSAFGFTAEEIMPNLQLLADVAAGNNERFSRLSLVFAQTRSAGKLLGQDLLQYVSNGFNPLQVISEKTGKSVSDLRKEMENGAISAEMVVDAFKAATSEGGKFYGMTEKMADSIEAAKTNFESAWVEKQIEWGNAAKDNIKTMYEFGSTVVENADNIAKSFAVLIAAVGSYKAALIAMSVWQKLTGIVEYTRQLLSATSMLTRATQAQILFNAAVKANPVGLIVSALAVATAAFFAFRKEAEDASESISVVGEATTKFKTSVQAEKVELDLLFSRLKKAKSGTQEYATAKNDILNKYGTYLEGLGSEIEALNDVEGAYKAISAAALQSARDRAIAETTSTLATNYAEREISELQRIQGYFSRAGLNESQTTIITSALAEQLRGTRELTEQEIKGLDTYLRKTFENLPAYGAGQVTDQGTEVYDFWVAPILENLKNGRGAMETEIENFRKIVNAGLGITEGGGSTGLTAEQLKALEKEAEARRKMYEQGLLDYETFQQGVERLAQEHATRVAAYEVEAQSPEQLAQLTSGSEAQMAEEIEALHEKHETERYLALEAAREQIEINNDRIADEWEAEEAAFEKQQQLQKELLSQYATYQQKRDALTKEYETNRAAMYEDDGATLKSGFTQGNVDELDSSSAELLAELDSEMAQRSATFQTWADTTLAMGVKQLKNALATAKSALASNEDLTDEERAILTEQIKVLQEKLDKSDSTEWGNTLKVMNEITDSVDNAVNSFDGLDDATKSALSAATNIAGGIIGMITGIKALAVTGAEAIKGVEKASVILAVIGAAVQIISSIANFFTARNKVAEETAQKNAELAQQEFLAQYEINQLYRERYDWAKKIGETEMQNAKRSIEEAKKQLEATSKEEDELLKKLQGEEYVTGYHTEETGLFGWGKGKTVEDRASLAGLSYDEILELEAQGKLTDEAQAYLDALRESKEEGEDLAETLEDAQEQLREAVVGMGFDEVVSHAMDDLLDGTKTAAEAFDEIMQGAMKNMLNEMMNEDVREWYEGFAAAGADGYTEAEKEYWKQRWEEMQEENEKRKEEVEDITGESFETTDQGQADASDITSIQEEAPGSIDGKLTALQLTSSQTAVNTTLLVDGQSTLIAGVAELRDGMDMLNYYAKNTYSEVKLIRESTDQLGAIATSVAAVATNTKNL